MFIPISPRHLFPLNLLHEGLFIIKENEKIWNCECDLFPSSLLAHPLLACPLHFPFPLPSYPPSALLKITWIWRIYFEKHLPLFHSSIQYNFTLYKEKWLPFSSMMLIRVPFLTVHALGKGAGVLEHLPSPLQNWKRLFFQQKQCSINTV
jgi:hypothetical protein